MHLDLGISAGNYWSRRRYCDKSTTMSDAVKFPNVVAVLKKLSPVSLAESWDNVGLLMEPDGRKSDTVDCVFFTNDLTEDVLKEAQLVRADLIVSYHPPIFTSFKRITLDSWKVSINKIIFF